MKNLYDAAVANQVKTRLGKLQPQSERLWGKMTAAQMPAHCSAGMQWALGEVAPEKGSLAARLMGRLVKPMVFRNEDPFRKNSPTARGLIVADERDLGKERARLSSAPVRGLTLEKREAAALRMRPYRSWASSRYV